MRGVDFPAEAGPVRVDLRRRPSIPFLVIVTLLVAAPAVVNPAAWWVSVGGAVLLVGLFVLGPRLQRRVATVPLALCENGLVIAERGAVVLVPWDDITEVAQAAHRHVFFEVHCGRVVILSPHALGAHAAEAFELLKRRCELEAVPGAKPTRMVRRTGFAER
jgi:hypothetical protein